MSRIRGQYDVKSSSYKFLPNCTVLCSRISFSLRLKSFIFPFLILRRIDVLKKKATDNSFLLNVYVSALISSRALNTGGSCVSRTVKTGEWMLPSLGLYSDTGYCWHGQKRSGTAVGPTQPPSQWVQMDITP